MAVLGNLIEQVRGVSYKPEDLHDTLNENSIVLLRANNIKDGKLNFDDVVYVDKKKVSEKQLLRAGDILICASSGSKELVGKAAYANTDLPMTFGAFCKVVRPRTECPRYIGHYFNSPYYRERITNSAAGANINNIRNEHIDVLEIIWPSTEKQLAVVTVLDKVTALIDIRKEQLAKLEQLVKSRFIELFGRGQYPMVKAEEVCDFITKGTTPPPGEISEKYEVGMIPYLKVYNLSFTGDLLFDNMPQYIPVETHNKQLARSKVVPNDVLMNIVGPPLGKFSLVSDEFPEWNVNQAIAIFRAKDKVLPRYLLAALMQPNVLRPFLEQAVGIRQLNLSLEQCRNLEFPLPPIQEQRAFVEFSEQTDKSKLTIQASLDKLEVMKKALMQEYFG